MELPYSQKFNSLHELSEVAYQFSKIISEPTVVSFNGNLGSGKTTFIKHLCENFNIKNVNSPSFSIVNEYIGEKKFYHFDFYRIKKIEELYDIGFEEYLIDDEAIILIEWANLFSEILPKSRLEITIELFPDNFREIQITKF